MQEIDSHTWLGTWKPTKFYICIHVENVAVFTQHKIDSESVHLSKQRLTSWYEKYYQYDYSLQPSVHTQS